MKYKLYIALFFLAIITLITLAVLTSSQFSTTVQVVFFSFTSVIIITLLVVYKLYRRLALDKVQLERYEYALNASTNGLWDWNLVEGTLYFSDSLKAILGYEPHEFASSFNAWKAAVHPDDIVSVEESIAKSHSSIMHKIYDVTYRMKHKNGSWIWVLDRGETIFDASENPIRMIGFHTDVTRIKVLENRLKDAQKLFEHFMKNNTYMVVIKNEENDIVYANERANTFFEQLLENSATSTLESHPYYELLITDVYLQKNHEKVVTIVTEEGNEYFRVISFEIKQLDDSNYTGVQFIDITDEYQTKLELLKYQDIIEMSPISIVITDIDANIEYVNPYFSKVTGYTREEVLGENPKVLKSKYQSKAFYETLWNTLVSKKPWHGVLKNIKKNGDYYWEQAAISPVLNSEGNITHYIGIKQEITQEIELKRDLLDESRKREELGAILDKTSNEVYIADAQKKQFVYINEGSVKNLGYSQKELLAMSPLDIIYDPEESFSLEQLFQEVLKSNAAVQIDTMHQRKDGSVYYASGYIQHTTFNYEEVFLAIFSDTSELIASREALKSQEKLMISQSRQAAMGEMIGMIAHQWRQPISIISMGVNNMLADIDLEQYNEVQFREELQDILQEADHLSQTIDDFRNFFKTDKETKKLLIEVVFEEALQVISKSLSNNGISVKTDYESQKSIEIYPRELLQVFINILANAKDAFEGIENEKIIRCHIVDEVDGIVIHICDNARGIKEELMHKIFEPYFSTKNEKYGTGLGLYMSKLIIEKHFKGTLKAYNHDSGACFEIKLFTSTLL